jgi:hypothetical protein
MFNNPSKPSKAKYIIPIGTLALGLMLGSAIGASTVKTVEVTKEVPGPERVVTKTVDKEVKVPVTPAACLEALDINEAAFDQLAKSLQYISDMDFESAKASNAKVSAMVPKSNAAKAECRAAK